MFQVISGCFSQQKNIPNISDVLNNFLRLCSFCTRLLKKIHDAVLMLDEHDREPQARVIAGTSTQVQ